MKRFLRQALGSLGLEVHRKAAGSAFGADLLCDVATLLNGRVSTVFDVGANEGQSVARYLKEFPLAQIFSFEPSARAFAKLSARFGAHERVKLFKLALDDTSGNKELHLNADNRTNSLLENAEGIADCAPRPWVLPIGSETVDVTTLDQYLESRSVECIDFLKLDTQGNELSVLRGAKGLLKCKRIKVVQVEVEFVALYQGQGLFCEIDRFMRANGYYLHGFYRQYRHGQHPRLIYPLIFADALYSAEKRVALPGI